MATTWTKSARRSKIFRSKLPATFKPLSSGRPPPMVIPRSWTSFPREDARRAPRVSGRWKQLLIDHYNIPESHILSSRDHCSFSAGIKRLTRNRGLDFVLNSMASVGALPHCLPPLPDDGALGNSEGENGCEARQARRGTRRSFLVFYTGYLDPALTEGFRKRVQQKKRGATGSVGTCALGFLGQDPCPTTFLYGKCALSIAPRLFQP